MTVFLVWNNPHTISKERGRLRKKGANRDHSEYSIIKINQNTEKSVRDLRRLAVSQTPGEKKQSANAKVKNSKTSKIKER